MPGKKFGKLGSKKQLRVWEIWVDGQEVHRRSGQFGGKMVDTMDIPGPAGKPGTKAFKSAEERALERAAYLIMKKTQGGYRPIDDDGNFIGGEAETDTVNFDELQRNYEAGKPLNPTTKRDLKKRQDLIESGSALYTLKEDGLCHHVLITSSGDVKIYTRKIEPCTESYPHLVKAFKQLKLPPKTLLTCEFVVKKPNGKDDRKAIQSLSKSKPERARKIQEDPLKRPTAVVLNAQFWAGKPILRDMKVRDWMQHLSDFFEGRDHIQYVRLMRVLFGSFDRVKNFVLKGEHEGLVIYDRDGTFGEKAFNLRGTTERTPCFKWKPKYVADCIGVFNPDGELHPDGIKGGKWGNGSIQGLPKNIALYQYDSQHEDRDLVYLCHCGSGFKHLHGPEELRRSEVLRRAKENEVIGVVMIEYASRFFEAEGDGSNALLEPIFVGYHPDKTLREAFEPRLRQDAS